MLISMILSAYRSFKARRRAIRELAELTDQDLADVGLVRSEIDRSGAGHYTRPLL